MYRDSGDNGALRTLAQPPDIPTVLNTGHHSTIFGRIAVHLMPADCRSVASSNVISARSTAGPGRGTLSSEVLEVPTDPLVKFASFWAILDQAFWGIFEHPISTIRHDSNHIA